MTAATFEGEKLGDRSSILATNKTHGAGAAGTWWRPTRRERALLLLLFGLACH
jgi:hypothetical protein